MTREAAIETATKDYYIAARWYIRTRTKDRKRIRKYLKLSEWGTASWTADPTKATRWATWDMATAGEIAGQHGADLLRMSDGI